MFNQPGEAAEIAPLVDFLSVHLYPDLAPGSDLTSADPSTYTGFAQNYLRQVAAAAPGKKIFVEEFGGQNGLAPAGGRPVAGSPAHQEAVIDAVLVEMEALVKDGIVGGTVWLAEPEPTAPSDGWALVSFTPPKILPALGDFRKYLPGSGG